MTNYDFLYNNCGSLIQENSDRFFEYDENESIRCFYVYDGSTYTKYTHYLYDSSGNRVKKLTRVSTGAYDSITYVDGAFEYRTDGTDEQTLNYVMDDASRIASIREGNDFGDTTPAIKYTIEDSLGSSVWELEDDGSNVNKEEYYPFGETSFGSYALKRYRFQGKEKDSESGLYYFGARYYSSWTGRFISVDNVLQPPESPYAGMGNNPINKIDPTGNVAIDVVVDGQAPHDNGTQTAKTGLFSPALNSALKSGETIGFNSGTGSNETPIELPEYHFSSPRSNNIPNYGSITEGHLPSGTLLNPFQYTMTRWLDDKVEGGKKTMIRPGKWNTGHGAAGYFMYKALRKTADNIWALEQTLIGTAPDQKTNMRGERLTVSQAADNSIMGLAEVALFVATLGVGAMEKTAAGELSEVAAKSTTEVLSQEAFAEEIVTINEATDGGGVLINGTPSSAINSALYYESVEEQGAFIFRSISGQHMFLNGNKRTAIAAVESFAKQYGLETVNRSQMEMIALQVAEGKIRDVSQIAKMLFK